MAGQPTGAEPMIALAARLATANIAVAMPVEHSAASMAAIGTDTAGTTADIRVAAIALIASYYDHNLGLAATAWSMPLALRPQHQFIDSSKQIVEQQ